MTKLFIDGKRSGYSPDQCPETMTVGQLRYILNEAVKWGDLDDDTPVYISNDNGYTYGELSTYYSDGSFKIGETWDEDSEPFCPYYPEDPYEDERSE